MVALTVDQLIAICPKLKKAKAGSLLSDLMSAAVEFHIDSPKRLASFLGQLAHEGDQFTTTSENLLYSAPRLVLIFPKYFTSALAKQYERKPEKIANRVYGNRFGNGDEASGDGWKFRGRGFIQLTFRSNYRQAGRALALDLENQPDLASQQGIACRVAGWYWDSHGCNALADEGDFLAITRRINGGAAGFQSRQQYWAKAKEVLGLQPAAG